MQIHHIVLTAKRRSRLPLWNTERDYLRALRRLGKTCADRAALFALVAEHTHLIAPLSRKAAGRLAQRTLVSLKPTTATPLAPSFIEEVTSRSHLRWLGKYVLEQPAKHLMPGHPALWVGSCLVDLLGARAIPGLSLRVRECLPDFHPAQTLAAVGIQARELLPADDNALRMAGVRRLAAAAAAAFGEQLPLKRNTPTARLARRAAVHLARGVGISTREVAEAMAISGKTVWRLLQRETPASTLRIVARRVALEDLVERPGVCPPGRRSGEVTERRRTSVHQTGSDLRW